MKSAQDLIDVAKADLTCHSAEEAAARCHDTNVLLIDLREPEENAASSVPVAVHIPRGVLEFKIAEACPDADREIVLHCGGGGRASLAAQSLRSMGYTNVSIVSAKFADFSEAFNKHS